MIRILAIDDHALVRAGLCRLLDGEPDMEVVGQAGTGREGIGLCETLQPDVVMLDYSLPDMDGLDVAQQLLAGRCSARILVLTMHDNEEYAIRLMRAGVSGFLVKGASPVEMLKAVRKVAAQGTYVSPAVQERIVGRIGQPTEDRPEESLSNREMQVLLRLAGGATTRETADELCLSLSTIETYRGRILEKLNCRNNSDLTRFAIRRGLIGVD